MKNRGEEKSWAIECITREREEGKDPVLATIFSHFIAKHLQTIASWGTNNRDHGIERPEGTRPPRRSRRPAQQSQRAPKENGNGEHKEPLQEPSGLQVLCSGHPLQVICYCPWEM